MSRARAGSTRGGDSEFLRSGGEYTLFRDRYLTLVSRTRLPVAGPEIRGASGPFKVSFESEEGLTKKYIRHAVLWSVFGVPFSAGGTGAAVTATSS